MKSVPSKTNKKKQTIHVDYQSIMVLNNQIGANKLHHQTLPQRKDHPMVIWLSQVTKVTNDFQKLQVSYGYFMKMFEFQVFIIFSKNF